VTALGVTAPGVAALGAAALGAAALLGLAGCRSDDDGPFWGTTRRVGKAPRTLYINVVTEPEQLDPARAGDNVATQLVMALFEGLTTPDPRDLHPVAGVAARFERSADNLRFRFHLRPEARWSDGRPVTSGDFVYAWRRAVRPETASPAAEDLFPVKNAERIQRGELPADGEALGVHAPDDGTLDVELERPTPYFLDLTSRPAYMPVRRDVVEAAARRGAADAWTRPESLVGNGPFVLSRWDFRYAIRMTPNPRYWARETLRLDEVVWLEIESSHAAMNLFKTGELDAFGSGSSIPPAYQALVGSRPDVRRFPLLMVYWYMLNTRAAPTDDARVRQALDLAIDKRALVAHVTRGSEAPATHYVPEITGGGYAEQLAADRAAGADPFAGAVHDPARARELLRAAGFAITEEGGRRRAEGFPPLEVLYGSGDDAHRLILVAIQDMWQRELGISARLRREEWKVMNRSVQEGHFQVAQSAWIADYNHPHTFLETFLSGSPQNPTGWASPEFDALVARAARTADPREGIRLDLAAEQLAVAARSRIPLFFPAGSTLVKPWVKGFEGNGRTLDLVRWFWIDPAWRDHPGNEPSSPPPELPPPGTLP
jgi:oligopeptide transport system substrate-binding protein